MNDSRKMHTSEILVPLDSREIQSITMYQLPKELYAKKGLSVEDVEHGVEAMMFQQQFLAAMAMGKKLPLSKIKDKVLEKVFHEDCEYEYINPDDMLHAAISVYYQIMVEINKIDKALEEDTLSLENNIYIIHAILNAEPRFIAENFGKQIADFHKVFVEDYQYRVDILYDRCCE